MNESSVIRTLPGRKPDLRSFSYEELEDVIKEKNEASYRTKQVFSWLHERPVRDFSEMSNLPAKLRESMRAEYDVAEVRTVKRQVSSLDGTEKYLFELRDGELVESVLMRYRYGNSVCISSQVGCRMGCRFCASTLDGLVRGLLPGEMLSQVYEIARITGERVSHVVVMGTGEPFDNYGNLVRFLKLVSDGRGMNLSQRNITVSTCGLVPEMKRFAKEGLSVTLALSLHAADDEKRRKIMPVANRYSIRELMEACAYYFRETGRRITFEYALIAGENDSEEDAAKLSRLAGEVRAHINLIPVNPVRENGFHESSAEAVARFRARLEKSGINVSIRRVMGRDIDGACGQLRHRHLSDTSASFGNDS